MRANLRRFIDTIENNLQCLKANEQDVDKWDAILIPIILSKLNLTINQEWEEKLNEKPDSNNKLPLLSELLEFLNTKTNVLESISDKKPDSYLGDSSKKPYIKNTTPVKLKFGNHISNRTLTSTTLCCPNCNGNHLIQQCDAFLKMDAKNRIERVKVLKLCLNCLRKGHFISNCISSRCRTCHQKHNTLLHFDTKVKEATSTSVIQFNDSLPTVPTQSGETVTPNECASYYNNSQCQQILLSTAKVDVYNYNSEPIRVRVLLDSASQSNFITERTCRMLNLPMQPSNTIVTGINQSSSNVKFSTTVKLKSIYSDFSRRKYIL
ncbi:uncharacterized protein LOC116170112 [Photinus pyralis]|uniref:uncharacterized protein LOC116170112 n=1 Tax=Photinus pyralis TaxID=7054 RepID=UPI0012677833|nr:uncharacterized protein LOC116170112 [Photinus pyralis]